MFVWISLYKLRTTQKLKKIFHSLKTKLNSFITINVKKTQKLIKVSLYFANRKYKVVVTLEITNS